MSIADKLQTIAENEQKVYDAGYEKGKAEGGGSDEPLIVDFSLFQNLRGVFLGSNVKRVKTVDARSATSGWNGMANMFYDSKIEEIQEFYPSTKTYFNGTFVRCKSLKRVIFKSEIVVPTLTFSYSFYLDRESIESVFSNLSTTTSELPVIFSISAVNKAFETDTGENDGSTSEEWLALVATKSNWTIALNDSI